MTKNTLKGTLRIAPYKDHDGILSPEMITEFVWKRIK